MNLSCTRSPIKLTVITGSATYFNLAETTQRICVGVISELHTSRELRTEGKLTGCCRIQDSGMTTANKHQQRQTMAEDEMGIAALYIDLIIVAS